MIEFVNLYHILLLALVQGFTEFLPISSSAHLVLVSSLFEFTYQGVWVDVVLHGATLLAAVVYFRKDLKYILVGILKKEKHAVSQFWYIAVATIPTLIVGVFIVDYLDLFRTPVFIGIILIIFGFYGVVTEKIFMQHTETKKIGLWEASLIGVSQIFSLLPGVSRSGVTISAGIVVGVPRSESSKFSFLISIPIIGIAFIYFLTQATFETFDISSLAVGFVVTFLIALLTIKIFIKYIDRFTLYPFSFYRILLGVVLLALVL